MDDPALILVAAITTATLLILALIYRPLIVECVDPGYLRSVGGWGAITTGKNLALTLYEVAE